jgi:hypothetical protein
MTYTEDEIQAVVNTLKGHFNNLSVSQVLSIAFDILRALKIAQEKANEKTNNNQTT